MNPSDDENSRDDDIHGFDDNFRPVYAEHIFEDQASTYSSLSNNRAGWNKCAGWKISQN